MRMDITAYRKEKGLSQAELAEKLTAAGFPATQGLISQWEGGKVVVTAERAIQLEQVTEGIVDRRELRPDLFGPMPAEAA